MQAPTSKLDDDAFTRVRIILMNGLEANAVRSSHATARMMNGDLRLPLAKVRRVEHHQQTMVNWLLPGRSFTTGNHKEDEADRAPLSVAYREHMNSEGSPSEIVAAGYTSQFDGSVFAGDVDGGVD